MHSKSIVGSVCEGNGAGGLAYKLGFTVNILKMILLCKVEIDVTSSVRT